ncbi:MAG: hypothetical protein F6J97_04195 [Leptolyngbya sp. SIO4C1]|nr:hypothetical protein [Leptolyngbya sp. SIO4C1]
MIQLRLGLLATALAVIAASGAIASTTAPYKLYQSSSFQSQETMVDIDSFDLSLPHLLEISTTGSQLSGQISLNGVVIKTLSGSAITLDLVPYLEAGENVVEVTGSYSPATASVQLSFTGPGTSITQQTSGSGQLAQTLVLQVW